LLIRAGLSLYALLGNLRPACRFRRLPRSRWDDLDGLVTRDLQAVYRYFDGQTDDALLTEAVMRSAMSLGAELQVPARFVGAELGAGGCEVRYLSASHGPTDRDETVDRRDTAAGGDRADRSDTADEGDTAKAGETTDEGDAARVADMADGGETADGKERTCRARVLINAAGPWVHQVLAAVSPAQRKVPIELVQGAHVEVRGRLERGIYYVESPRDGRAVFFMPRGEMTLVGTTEVRFRGDDPGEVHALRCERIYLTRLIRRYFPRLLPDGRQGIARAWAGIRVLPAGSGHAFHRSRETVLAGDREIGNGPPRLLSIYGGKLTTYRSTAQKVMERIAPALPARRPVADTARLTLSPP
jgi:glycerol-3-phosphate dehydrogenase